MPTQDKGIDLIAYDDAGRAVLAAEVKSRVGTSEAWAARFRRNIMAHGTVPQAMFFLIATPDRMYFWKQNGMQAEDARPELTVDAATEFQRYFEKLDRPTQPLSENALELLVALWLGEIATAGNADARRDPSMRWLWESGLIGSLDKARIETNPA
jgi:hypothetical protein